MGLKSKLTFVQEPKISKDRVSAACFALKTGLLAAKDVSGSIGVPGLSIAITGLILTVDLIQKTVRNAEDIEELTERLKKLTEILSQALERGTTSHLRRERINRLTKIFQQVSDRTKAIGSRGIFKRTLTYGQDEQCIRREIQAMTWTVESFTVETALNVEFMLDEHVRFVQDATQVTHTIVGATYKAVQGFSASREKREGYLAHAAGAAFNSAEREACSDSTREEILSEILEWIYRDSAGPEEGLGDNVISDPRIFWINGSAGTGKTTIAYTVAKQCWDSSPSILGASFFCSRDDVDCSNLGLIFTTIALQLGVFNPAFAGEVARVLKAKPDIGYASVHYQLSELIVKPLAIVRHSFGRCIVVLDALDECKDPATISTVLSALSHYVLDLFPLKFLVSSRPETHITMGFTYPALRHNTKRVVLHELELHVVQRDIQTFLSSRLLTTKALYNISDSWPPLESLRTLAQLSAGLFIFAATSVKFIEDPFYSNPREQLATLLRNTGRVVGKSSPYDRLDGLYSEILKLAYPDISYEHLRVLKTVLGSILHLRDPISPLGLENLLGLGAGRVRETLLRLHSVVIVPDDDSQCIRLLHPSFFDFLTDPARCPIPLFAINIEEQNTVLALFCLRSLNGLVRDMCRIETPWLLNLEVNDLASRISACIPTHIQYAARHWAYHLSASVLTEALLAALDQFASDHLLHWIEVCSLLGELRAALDSISHLRRSYSSNGRLDTRTMTLLSDCEHLIREFFPVISISALQVYHSALLFAPDQAFILKKFKKDMDLPVKTYNSVDSTWSLCETVIDGQSAAFQAVCCSPDGTQILSGSRNGFVQLWDASSGVHLQTMDGQTSSVTSVAFSLDGTLIVAGLIDGSVPLWDAGTGGQVGTFRGHSHSVEYVAFCPTKPYIVSASHDTTVRLWDAQQLGHIRTLEGHSAPVLCLTFSTAGSDLVSGSADQTVRIWDIQYGTSRILRRYPEWVMSVACSSDGIYIAAGCSDQTVWICDASSGANARALRGHNGRITSVAFSPDAKRLVSGSMDHTAKLWDTASGANILTLNRHSEWVMAVAFSFNGTRVLTASVDKTIRIWDVSGGTHLQAFHGQSVKHVTFSTDGTMLAFLSGNETIQVWDISAGILQRCLRGHQGAATFLGFSPDNAFLVLTSGRKLKIWSQEKNLNKPIRTLKGHRSWVMSVAFSPSQPHVASGSEDRMIFLWDIETGDHLKTFQYHSDTITYLAFSRDGARLVSGSIDATIGLWDANTGALLEKLSSKILEPNQVVEKPNLEASHSNRSMATEAPMPVEFCTVEAGWMCLGKDRKRIFWIPVMLRPVNPIRVLQPGRRITYQSKGGKSVIVEFSNGVVVGGLTS